jgi:hypothetical protein
MRSQIYDAKIPEKCRTQPEHTLLDIDRPTTHEPGQGHIHEQGDSVAYCKEVPCCPELRRIEPSIYICPNHRPETTIKLQDPLRLTGKQKPRNHFPRTRLSHSTLSSSHTTSPSLGPQLSLLLILSILVLHLHLPHRILGHSRTTSIPLGPLGAKRTCLLIPLPSREEPITLT